MGRYRIAGQFLRRWLAMVAATTLVCAQLCAQLFGQQAQPPAAPIPAPTIRVTTHMVLVDVVVTDKQGKAVTGLHPEDFVVEENGKAQKIASLTTPSENAPAAPALPPGIYSNKPQYRSTGAPITVMLLDALNTPFTDQAYARRQMLAFVKENFKPGDRMAVFTLTGPMNVLQDFTGDPQTLYTALQRYRPQTQPLTSSTQPAISNADGPATTGSVVASLDASSRPPSDSGQRCERSSRRRRRILCGNCNGAVGACVFRRRASRIR